MRTLCECDPGRLIPAIESSPRLYRFQVSPLSRQRRRQRRADATMEQQILLIPSSQVDPQPPTIASPVLNFSPKFKRGTTGSMHQCESIINCLKSNAEFELQDATFSPQHHHPKAVQPITAGSVSSMPSLVTSLTGSHPLSLRALGYFQHKPPRRITRQTSTVAVMRPLYQPQHGRPHRSRSQGSTENQGPMSP